MARVQARVLASRIGAGAAQAFNDSREQVGMRREAARLAYRTAALPSAVLLLASVVPAALVVAYVYFSGEMLAAIPAAARSGWASPAGEAVARYLAAVGACFLGSQVLSAVKARLAGLVTRRVNGATQERLAAASAGIGGLAAFEDQALLRELSIAGESGQFSPGDAVAGLASLAGAYVQAFLAALLIAVLLSPLVAAGLLGGGLLIRRAHRIGLVLQTNSRSRDWGMVREAGYYRGVALDGAAGREIRVFGLAGWLRGRYREHSLRSVESSLAVRRRVNGMRFVWPALFATLAAVASLLWVASHAGTTAIPVRSLVIGLQAGYLCLQIGYFFQEDWGTQFGLFGYEALGKFEAGAADLAAADPLARWHGTRDPAGMPAEGVAFDAVSFHYPGASRLVLDGLSLEIPAGQSLAVVGLNGAGKTTLVKLLAGLYQPTSGAVRVDGTDLREFRLAAWQRNVAAIYQDFERYELTAAENIAFGDAASPAARDDIRWAAERAGILDVLEGLPRGLGTPLAPGYTDGADLSGGQWQRVALSRAFYALRAGARILVLDEPTASLDVRGEAEFLARFMELTRGVTTVVISHRFACVRHADRIVVLDGGRITEQGTHETLLAADGRYAELFRLQAGRFADDSPDAAEPEGAR